MKVSELITQLTEMRTALGDLPVMLWNDEWWLVYPPTDLRYVAAGKEEVGTGAYKIIREPAPAHISIT